MRQFPSDYIADTFRNINCKPPPQPKFAWKSRWKSGNLAPTIVRAAPIFAQPGSVRKQSSLGRLPQKRGQDHDKVHYCNGSAGNLSCH